MRVWPVPTSREGNVEGKVRAAQITQLHTERILQPDVYVKVVRRMRQLASPWSYDHLNYIRNDMFDEWGPGDWEIDQ